MDVFSELTETNSIQNDGDIAYLHSPHIGLSEPEDTMSSESEYLDEEDMYVACYDDESVHSGLESDSESPHSEEIVCAPFPVT
jgi:hypothetical protein